MIDDTDWQSDAEDKKQLKRKAADKFMAATLNDADLRKNVIANPGYARETFQKIGEIVLPEYVEVICVDPDRVERNKLVVFVLPKKKSASGEYWQDSWLAAWQPY